MGRARTHGIGGTAAAAAGPLIVPAPPGSFVGPALPGVALGTTPAVSFLWVTGAGWPLARLAAGAFSAGLPGRLRVRVRAVAPGVVFPGLAGLPLVSRR